MEKISVIIPVYNGELYLKEAIESVKDQDYPCIELIIVDDGSTDKTAQIAKEFPEGIYLFQNNQGPSAARNYGVSQATGSLLAFLDHDDLWVPHKLSTQVALLNENHGFVISDCHVFVDPHHPPAVTLRKELLTEPQPTYIPSSLLIRTEIFKQVGGFNREYRTDEDTDLILRLKDRGVSHARSKEPLLYHRMHQTNTSYQNACGFSPSRLLQSIRSSIHRKVGSHAN